MSPSETPTQPTPVGMRHPHRLFPGCAYLKDRSLEPPVLTESVGRDARSSGVGTATDSRAQPRSLSSPKGAAARPAFALYFASLEV